MRSLQMIALILSISLHNTGYADNILGPKTGIVNWGNNSFDIMGSQVGIKSETHPIGFEYNYLFPSGLTVGGDFSSQKLDLIGSGHAYVYRYLAMFKYYLAIQDDIRPFFGGGIGRAKISIHGADTEPNATLFGPINSAIAGVKFQIAPRFALSLEYRLSRVSVHDNATRYKSTNNELYLLMSFNRESPY